MWKYLMALIILLSACKEYGVAEILACTGEIRAVHGDNALSWALQEGCVQKADPQMQQLFRRIDGAAQSCYTPDYLPSEFRQCMRERLSPEDWQAAVDSYNQ